MALLCHVVTCKRTTCKRPQSCLVPSDDVKRSHVCLPTHPRQSVCQFACLSANLSVCMSVSLSVRSGRAKVGGGATTFALAV